jgi:hypothetical protein
VVIDPPQPKIEVAPDNFRMKMLRYGRHRRMASARLLKAWASFTQAGRWRASA